MESTRPGAACHRIAAWQTEPRWEQSQVGEHFDRLIGQAAGAGAELVVLPTGLGWADLPARLGLPLDAPFGLEPLLASGHKQPRWLTACRLSAQQGLAACCTSARNHKIWVAGPALLWVTEQEHLFVAAPVIDAAGEVNGWQYQTHVPAPLRAYGLAQSAELGVIPTPVGAIGLLLGEDVLFPEVSRVLSLMGAELLVHLGAWREDSQSQWMSRLWREVQSNQTFGIETALSGAGYAGRARAYAPCEMTPGQMGLLAESKQEGEALLLAELDEAARRAVIARYPIYASLNPRLYARYWPALYAPAAGREQDG